MNQLPSIPTATYRLQFNQGFTFNDARAVAGYLHELGISHVYASPIFKASPGSPHGYDVCDHNQLNSEVGTRAEFEALADELSALGMSQILDFVPNHMGIAESTNGWWMDVLENGPSSPYARYFDIDWTPAKQELAGKVLLPILGDQYGRVLESGDLRLSFEKGAFSSITTPAACRSPRGPRDRFCSRQSRKSPRLEENRRVSCRASLSRSITSPTGPKPRPKKSLNGRGKKRSSSNGWHASAVKIPACKQRSTRWSPRFRKAVPPGALTHSTN